MSSSKRSNRGLILATAAVVFSLAVFTLGVVTADYPELSPFPRDIGPMIALLGAALSWISTFALIVVVGSQPVTRAQTGEGEQHVR